MPRVLMTNVRIAAVSRSGRRLLNRSSLSNSAILFQSPAMHDRYIYFCCCHGEVINRYFLIRLCFAACMHMCRPLLGGICLRTMQSFLHTPEVQRPFTSIQYHRTRISYASEMLFLTFALGLSFTVQLHCGMSCF